MASSAFPERREAHSIARRFRAGPTKLVFAVLAAFFAAAWLLRGVGAGFQLPHEAQIDEQVFVLQANWERDVAPPESKRALPYAYPTLFARGLVHAAEPREPATSATLDEHLHAASEPVASMRRWLALVAALSIPLVYVLARRFSGRGVSLLAAAWTCVSVLHVWYGSQARPHAAASTLTLLAVWACLALRRRPTWTRYVLAGSAVGLAFGALQSGLLTLPALIAAHLMRRRAHALENQDETATAMTSHRTPSASLLAAASHSDSPRSALLRAKTLRSALLRSATLRSALLRSAPLRFALAVALAFGVPLVFYAHGYPTASDEDAPNVLEQVLHRVHGLDASFVSPRGFAAIGRAFVDYEPWLGLWAAVGLVGVTWVALRSSTVSVRTLSDADLEARAALSISARTEHERREHVRDAWVIGAHALTHLVVFGFFANTFQRFLLPVVPYACLLAAWATGACARRLSKARVSRGVPRALPAIACACALLAPQVFLAFKLAWIKCAPDSGSLAAAWVRGHVERESERLVIVPTVEVPLVRTRASLPDYLALDRVAFHPWVEYQLALSPGERDRHAYDLRQAPLMAAADRRRLREDPDAYVQALDARYVIAEVQPDGRRPVAQAFRDAVARAGRLVARFGPSDTDPDVPPILYRYDGPLAPERGFAWNVARATRQGPTLEIYALGPDPAEFEARAQANLPDAVRPGPR